MTHPPDYIFVEKKDWLELLLKKISYKQLLLLAIPTAIALIFPSEFMLGFVFIFTILFSYFARKTGLKKFGIDFVTFATVIYGIKFGALVGCIAGILLISIHNIISRRIGAFWLIVLPTFGAIGILAGIFSNSNLFFMGTFLAIISHISFVMYKTVISGFPRKYLLYMLINVLFNALLFANIAPTLLKMI